VVIGVVVWAVTAFAYYRPRIEATEVQARNWENQSNMQLARISEMRRQLEDARVAAKRAQDAGKVFAEVIQQLDKAFKELGLQTEEMPPQEGAQAPGTGEQAAPTEQAKEGAPAEAESKAESPAPSGPEAKEAPKAETPAKGPAPEAPPQTPPKGPGKGP
jgi:uncharacterized phage infection (PIP) family protein YhgE